jgi:hypothetical protein
MAAENPLKRIYEINEALADVSAAMEEDIKPLLAQIEEIRAPFIEHIKELVEERDRCMEAALSKGITKKGGYRIDTITTPGRKTRVPRVGDVISTLKKKFGAKKGMEEALNIAKFEIKSLTHVLTDDEIDEVCDVKTSDKIERVVVKE